MEPVAGLLRNQWPLSPGMTGRLAVEYAHCVPHDIRALVGLYENTRAMDIYTWLSYRLPKVKERAEVFAAFGPEERMQVYGRGLRRRLPPMLDGDPRRLRMVYSLLFSLPGTPVLFYGEEIGMGENLEVDGRLAVRTPMQWTDGPNGGFSTAPPRRLTSNFINGVTSLPLRWGARTSS